MAIGTITTSHRVVHRITPAKAHSWALCGGFFRAQYLTGAPYAETYSSRLGIAVHELAAVYDGITTRDGVSIDDLITRNWRHGRFAKEDDGRAREEARHLFSLYAAVRANETVQVMGNEVFCQTGPYTVGEDNAIILSGRIDRIARRSDGTIEALDLKTGDYLQTQDELYTDPATTIYHLLVAERHATQCIAVTQLSLRTGACVEVVLDEAGLTAGKERLREMVRQLAANTFSLTPSASCAFCLARIACPAIQGADAATHLPF